MVIFVKKFICKKPKVLEILGVIRRPPIFLEAMNSGFDLCYLLEASDDELRIPPNPVLDIKDEDGLSTKETSKDLLASLDLKSLGENWHFEDDFQNYQQIAVYEDFWNPS